MFFNARLQEERRFFRGKPGTEPIDHQCADMLTDMVRILIVAGECVPVGNEKKTIIFILHGYPIGECSVKVP